MRQLLILAAIVLWTSGCGQTDPAPANQITVTGPVLHLLFIGNSYTYVNDMPRILTELAASGHHGIVTELSAPGGYTLAQHSTYPPTLDKIKAGPWDYVVLQDQSYLPALEQGRTQEMEPGVKVLAGLIRQAGAKPLLYMTWGRQKGLPEQGFADFDSMQTQLTKAYIEVGQEQNIPVAPVGTAWKNALEHDPALLLWRPDGSHPSVEGTYLTACVFYAVLYQQNPVGLDFTAGLPKDQAKTMQDAAAKTVLTPVP